jgi:hypothetical protein
MRGLNDRIVGSKTEIWASKQKQDRNLSFQARTTIGLKTQGTGRGRRGGGMTFRAQMREQINRGILTWAQQTLEEEQEAR